MRQLNVEWECAAVGTSFTVFFPGKGTCSDSLVGDWTITKIKPYALVTFSGKNKELLIPHADDCLIVATATKASHDMYHLTRGSVKDIFTWAREKGISISFVYKVAPPLGHWLEYAPSEFFSTRRFHELRIAKHIAQRAHRIVLHLARNPAGTAGIATPPLSTMQDFLCRYRGYTQLEQTLVKKDKEVVDAIAFAITSAGLPFEG